MGCQTVPFRSLRISTVATWHPGAAPPSSRPAASARGMPLGEVSPQALLEEFRVQTRHVCRSYMAKETLRTFRKPYIKALEG